MQRIFKNTYYAFVVMGLMLILLNCGGGKGDTPGAEETNANLSELFLSVLSDGTLKFHPDTTFYPVEVANDVTSVTVTATTNQSDATLKINGTNAESDTAFGPVNLDVGQNTIRLVVTSSNGSVTKTYTVTVTRKPAQVLSNNANLSDISLSDGTLSPGFNENVTTYNVQVPDSVSSIAVTPIMAGVNASITVNETKVVSGTASPAIDLNTGSNTITVQVMAEDGVTPKTYTLSVNRLPAPSSNANLANLTLSQGTLAPAFHENTITYTVQVPYNITTMTLTPTVADANAIITVNDSVVDSGSPSQAVALSTGHNTITVVVTAQDEATKKTYTIAVTKLDEPSHNANLANLSLSSGTLSPSFNENTTAYTVQVLNAISSVTVTPTSADSFSMITVNDQSVSSGTSTPDIPLAVGSNTMTVSVTAQDGTTPKTYTVVVTRLAEPSHNANLSGITLSNGTLSPGFDENTVAYNVQVPHTVPSVTVTPVMAGVNASITVNGTAVVSGAASPAIDLNTGSNTITVQVMAEDGVTPKTYALAVNRLPAPSSNANLANLTLSQGPLAPAFNENTIVYTVQVPYTVTSLTLTPTVADSNATQTVNGTVVGSGFPSQDVLLSTGSNTITVVVTAQDGTTTKTYTVVVTKLAEPSHNANLAGVTLSSGTLSPVFSGETLSYTAEVANIISSITVTPTCADSHSTVTVNGQAVISGISSQNIPLTVGNSTITVDVTAEDGSTTKTYTVTVTRLSLSSNASLANLTLSAGALDPSFTGAGLNYTASVDNNISSLSITPTCAGVNATVLVNGSNVVSGTASLPMSLQVGANTFTVIVTAEDTTTTQTYTIVVTRDDNDYRSQNLPDKVFALTVATTGQTIGNDEEKRKAYVDDMAQKAQDNGFNTVNLILDWGDLEPKEGEIQFDMIDSMIVSIKSRDLFCILRIYANAGYHHQGWPSWLKGIDQNDLYSFYYIIDENNNIKPGLDKEGKPYPNSKTIENIHPRNEIYKSKFQNFLNMLADHFNTEKLKNQYIQPDGLQITIGGDYGEMVFGDVRSCDRDEHGSESISDFWFDHLMEPEKQHIDMAKIFIDIPTIKNFILSVNSIEPHDYDNNGYLDEDDIGLYAMEMGVLNAKWIQSNGGFSYLLSEEGENNLKMLTRFKVNEGSKIIIEDTEHSGNISEIQALLNNMNQKIELDGLVISVNNLDDVSVKNAIAKIKESFIGDAP